MSSAQEHEASRERGRESPPGAPASDTLRPRSERDGARTNGGSRGRTVRKAPDERRAEIAEAARELALDDGLAAVTLRGVAGRAGVTPALVAHYRPNMDELVAETFRTIVAAELREIAELARHDGPAGERLGLLVHTLLDGGRDDVTLVWVEAWALGRRNETLAAAVREEMDAWQAVLHDLIAEGATAGEFEVDDPAAVAWQLLGMIDGLNAQALVRWGEGRSVLLTHALEGMLGLERGALAGAAGAAPR